MQKTNQILRLMLVSLMVLACTACYHQPRHAIGMQPTAEVPQDDTLSFFTTHHYAINFNFSVKADSLVLLMQQPEELVSAMPTDSFAVYKGEHLVVADIRILGRDPVDSVWVQVANEMQRFGWARESSLLPAVVPDDPISEFISTFSDTHLLIFLIFISIITVAYIMRKLMRMDAPIVHFRDIGSFYPTLLALIVAASATFYASIQTFAPEVWRHFYYNPTLNPFDVPPILSVFLISVWAMLIVGIAALDDVRRLLPIGDAYTYLCGLAAVCAVNYIVFSITTLYYIGYLFLCAYIYYALHRYFVRSRLRYTCGQCGTLLRHKGRCPNCGTLNG